LIKFLKILQTKLLMMEILEDLHLLSMVPIQLHSILLDLFMMLPLFPSS